MIDNLSIGLTHMLLAILIWRLLARDDLDVEPVESGLQVEPTPDHPVRPARPALKRRKKQMPG